MGLYKYKECGLWLWNRISKYSPLVLFVEIKHPIWHCMTLSLQVVRFGFNVITDLPRRSKQKPAWLWALSWQHNQKVSSLCFNHSYHWRDSKILHVAEWPFIQLFIFSLDAGGYEFRCHERSPENVFSGIRGAFKWCLKGTSTFGPWC